MGSDDSTVLIVVVVAVVAAVVIGLLFAYGLGFIGAHMGHGGEEKPRISIDDISIIDTSQEKVYVRVISTSDKTYVVTVRVEGCVSKTYNNIVIEPGVKDIAIDIPFQKLMQGCQFKIYIIYNNEVIASKTLQVKLS